MSTGRFAPSPSGPLHLGNLRTALIAWCAARSSGGRFLIRMEDLTTGAEPVSESSQLADLAALGLDHDGPVVRQSDRRSFYDAAIATLEAAGRTYPCFCSRREIVEAAQAPHGPDTPGGTYLGTCRDLTPDEVASRIASGRSPAVRLRADAEAVTATDLRLGELTMAVDDFVVRRADGVAAYNLAVVVDDAAQDVTQVVRGDDLWPTTPRQVMLGRLLGFSTPEYLHVPLVLGVDGERLAKRHGGVTLADHLAAGRTPADVLGLLATSLGMAAFGEEVTPDLLASRFDPQSLPSTAWVGSKEWTA